MDRKIKDEKIPQHQEWLYQLSDMGLVKAVLLLWGICLATIALVIAGLKVFFHFHK